jgi:DNA processing protein
MIDFNTLAHATAALVLKSTQGVSLATASKYIMQAPPMRDSADIASWLMMVCKDSIQFDGDLIAKKFDLIEKGLTINVIPVPISGERYPAPLRLILDPPPVIFVRGGFKSLEKPPGIAVVGTRKASKFGLEIASRIASYTAERGVVVVSGLALGIDAAAHIGALRSGGLTVAVLAHGLEKASPLANANLAEEILEAGGSWVSEHPIRTPAIAAHFVQRNRIQVGLISASVIVEGELRSGSKTQAEFCLRNKRELFAVLPSGKLVGQTVSELPFELVQSRGATALISREDYPHMLELMQKKRLWISERLAEEAGRIT